MPWSPRPRVQAAARLIPTRRPSKFWRGRRSSSEPRNDGAASPRRAPNADADDARREGFSTSILRRPRRKRGSRGVCRAGADRGGLQSAEPGARQRWTVGSTRALHDRAKRGVTSSALALRDGRRRRDDLDDYDDMARRRRTMRAAVFGDVGTVEHRSEGR